MNNDEYSTWEYVMQSLTEKGKPIEPGFYHEGLLEFHEGEIKADPKMFEKCVMDDLYFDSVGGHRVWSVRNEGSKWWYMVGSEAFKELVLMAIECQERRNSAQGVEAHQLLFEKWQASEDICPSCKIENNEH